MSKDAMQDMVGQVITGIHGLDEESDLVVFLTSGGDEFHFYHDQCCCEEVRLIDFENDVTLGSTVISAEAVSSSPTAKDECGTHTWTFYKIETSSGEVWMRWLGESNGYYGEEVEVSKICYDNPNKFFK